MIARHFNVAETHVLVTRGVDEAIDLMLAEYHDARFAYGWPGFKGYGGRLKAVGLHERAALIGLSEDYGLRLDSIEVVCAGRLVFIASPSNPTGRPLSAAEFELILASASHVFLDETYIDYGPRLSRIHLASERLTVFRSFSKFYGLAGLRLGFVAGDPGLVEQDESGSSATARSTRFALPR